MATCLLKQQKSAKLVLQRVASTDKKVIWLLKQCPLKRPLIAKAVLS